MTGSLLNEIRSIRGTSELIFDRRNRNRYTILVWEENGSHTAYCFGTPIYHAVSRQLISCRFQRQENGFCFAGSNAWGELAPGEITMRNREGAVKAVWDNCYLSGDSTKVCFGGAQVMPSLNGLLFQVPSTRAGTTLCLYAEKPFLRVRANSKYFALMSEEFRPYTTLSAIGVSDALGSVCAPAEVLYQQIDDQRYTVTVRPLDGIGQSLWFEWNLYESKLFQDTTVESNHPQENNAFGGIAFLGNSQAFGEQWLYVRPDWDKIPLLLEKQIIRMRWFLPNLSGRSLRLSAFRTAQRFCSFGSNWENKTGLAHPVADTCSIPRYEILDLTGSLTDPATHFLQRSEGLILRASVKKSGFVALATGDSYSYPPILEINFR